MSKLGVLKVENKNTIMASIMPEHVQKELLKLHGIEFHGNIIIIEEATSTRIKRPDENKTGSSRNKRHTGKYGRSYKRVF